LQKLNKKQRKKLDSKKNRKKLERNENRLKQMQLRRLDWSKKQLNKKD
jgi:hypothetical protein